MSKEHYTTIAEQIITDCCGTLTKDKVEIVRSYLVEAHNNGYDLAITDADKELQNEIDT